MTPPIQYREIGRYKYMLTTSHPHAIDRNEFSSTACDLTYLTFVSSLLIIRKGYAWDGPSGPTIDTRTFMRASLVHDALYQLMRDGFVHDKDISRARRYADGKLRRICIEDGMWRFRAWYVWTAVRLFGWLVI